ncbi:MAG: methylenetetrahydrofolate reductase [bacterium]
MTLQEKIKSGRFVITAELGPPQSANGDVIRRKAKYFKDKVDAVNITDNQTAIVRLSSIASAVIAIQEGLEPVIQMTCRDRNRIAIQSDLLGAAACGIKNVLCLSGDFQKFGNHPEAKPVFDMDSIQLIATATRMSQGKFISGDTIKTPPDLFVGGAANPFAPPREMRIIRLIKKIKAGAGFIQTQPVFDIEVFKEWMKQVRDKGLDQKTAILAGVMPVKSEKALEYMQREVPGVVIPEKLIARIKQAGSKKEKKTEGVRIASETIRELREIIGVSGIHLMPLMWEKITPHLLEQSGLTE